MIATLQTIGNTLYGCIVFGVLAFALLFLGTQVDLFGYEVKVVQSGSMEPAIPTGAIVVVANTAAYTLGDVITFQGITRNSIPITHRIIGVTGEGTQTRFQTQGDANEDPDSRTVPISRVLGEVVLTVPYVGYLIEFARQPWGFALLVGIPAIVIILDEFANIMWEIHKYRHARKRARTTNAPPPSKPTAPRASTPSAARSVESLRRQPTVRREPVLDLRPYKANRRAL